MFRTDHTLPIYINRPVVYLVQRWHLLEAFSCCRPDPDPVFKKATENMEEGVRQ